MLDKDCGYEDRPSVRNSPKEIFRVPLGFIIHQITKKVVEKNTTHKAGITVAPAGQQLAGVICCNEKRCLMFV